LILRVPSKINTASILTKYSNLIKRKSSRITLRKLFYTIWKMELMAALLHMDHLIQENVIYILSKHRLYLEISVKKKQIQIKTLVLII
jgi:hypothetical protein